MSMRKILKGSAVCALFVLPFAVQAGDLDYSFVQGVYNNINDPSGSGLSSDHAYELDGSWALPSNLVVQGSYAHETADTVFPGETISGNLYSLGLGYRLTLNDRWDFFPSVNYDSQKATAQNGFGSASVTFTGYDVMLKFRGMVTDQLELDPGYDFSRLTSSGFNPLTTNTLLIHGFYNFTPNFALGLGYENATNGGTATNTWKLMFRYNFH